MIRRGVLTRFAASVAAVAVLSAFSPRQAQAQSGLFCPNNGAVVVNYQGQVYLGAAVQTGTGWDASYSFLATSASGTYITGTFNVSWVDCAIADTGPAALVDAHNVQVNGYGNYDPGWV